MTQPTDPFPVSIVRLQDTPAALPRCARWLNDQWGRSMGYNLADTTEWLHDIEAPSSGEAAFVALDGDEAVGICLLVKCDLESRPEFTPWISGFYVLPDFRRRAIGTRLLAAIVEAARSSGATELYLYTHTAERLYRRLGWQELERFSLEGEDHTLMAKPLT